MAAIKTDSATCFMASFTAYYGGDIMNDQGKWDAVQALQPSITALVIADHDAFDAISAIEAAGARLLSRVDWASASARLDPQGRLRLIGIDCIGVAEDALAATLPRIDQFVRDNGARVVATLAPNQVDLVAANLFGTHVELLCTPSPVEHAAAYALSLSSSGPDRLFDSARGPDTERLRRLNEEIARIAKTLTRLSRVDSTEVSVHRTVHKNGSISASIADDQPPISSRDVRGAIRARRLRDQYFDVGLFEDPAWDILLDLFAAELEGVQVSVSSLCIAAAVAPTTALRWIARMTEADLLARVPDAFDRRRAFMELAPAASEAMLGYLGGLKRAGLAIG